MSQKFFTLIQGANIHLKEGKKIIPKEELGAILESRELLEKVQEDATHYRKEIIEECEVLRENAEKEGYEEGFKSWLEHVAKLEEEIGKVRKEFEKNLIPIALKAAKKIVGQEIELRDDAIVDIVANALKPVATHKKITVYVNKKDFEILEKNKPKLKSAFELLETFAIRERADVMAGGCIIETEGGIINAQLENQWRTLEKAFDNLVKQKDRSGSKNVDSPV